MSDKLKELPACPVETTLSLKGVCGGSSQSGILAD